MRTLGETSELTGMGDRRERQTIRNGRIKRLGQWMSGFSLRTRLLLCLYLPVTILLGIIGWVVFDAVGISFEEKMQEEVELIARTLERPITYSLSRERTGSVEDALRAAFVFDRVYGAFLYDLEGSLLAKAGSGVPTQREVRRFSRIADRGDQRGRYDLVGGEAVFSFFVPLKSETGEQLGLLQVTRSNAEMQATLKTLQRNFILGYTLFAFVFIGLVAGNYGLSIERPLSLLNRTMRRIERGDTSDRATPEGPSEFRRLAASLNHMLASIEEQQAELLLNVRQKAELKRRLRSAEKLAVLGEMAGSIGHEIGTPLSTIDGLAQRGIRAKVSNADPADAFGGIRKEVKRLEEFVHQLLSFDYNGKKSLFPVDLVKVLTDAAQTAQGNLSPSDARLALTLEIDASRKVLGDSLRLEIAFRNIFRNALQSKPSARVNCTARGNGDKTVIEVDDDGPGIQPDERETVFEPFVSGRGGSGGRGLGLTLAQRIIDEHGGQIGITDSPVGGARFTLTLPAHQTEQVK